MPTISKQQPMRPAEIDLVDQVNVNTVDIETNRKSLAQEVTDRTNADTALGNRITTETNDRKNTDNTLQANIDAEAQARKAADTTLTNNLNSEISRAKAAEQANATAISDEATRAKAAEQVNATAITDETTRAKAAEEANATAISDEATRAKAAEQVNATAITDETTRAKAAEEANADNITTLQNKFPIKTDDIGDLQVSNAKLAENAVTTDRITDKNVTAAKLEDSVQQQLTFLQSVPVMEFGTSNSVNVSANSNATVDITFKSVKTEAPVVLCGLQHSSGNLACVVSGVTNQQCSINVYNLTSTDVTGVTVDYLAISGR